MTGFHAPRELAVPRSGPEKLISYQLFLLRGSKIPIKELKGKTLHF